MPKANVLQKTDTVQKMQFFDKHCWKWFVKMHKTLFLGIIYCFLLQKNLYIIKSFIVSAKSTKKLAFLRSFLDNEWT